MNHATLTGLDAKTDAPRPRPPARHCPFLNREDERCAPQFSIGHLDFALDHCCGQYADCPAYRAQVAERQSARRAAAHEEVRHAAPQAVTITPITLDGRPAIGQA